MVKDMHSADGSDLSLQKIPVGPRGTGPSRSRCLPFPNIDDELGAGRMRRPGMGIVCSKGVPGTEPLPARQPLAGDPSLPGSARQSGHFVSTILFSDDPGTWTFLQTLPGTGTPDALLRLGGRVEPGTVRQSGQTDGPDLKETLLAQPGIGIGIGKRNIDGTRRTGLSQHHARTQQRRPPECRRKRIAGTTEKLGKNIVETTPRTEIPLETARPDPPGHKPNIVAPGRMQLASPYQKEPGRRHSPL